MPPTDRDVLITHLKGTLKIKGINGDVRDAKRHEKLKPGDVVFPQKKSCARFGGDGFAIAWACNEKGKKDTHVVTRHPLARAAVVPKHQLKATILKSGGRLTIQAQRESYTGVRRYNLCVDLGGEDPS